MEPARGLLLKLARREGRKRVALRLLALDGAHGEGRFLQGIDEPPGLLAVSDLGFLACDLDELGLEGGRVGPLEGRRDRPVFLGLEAADLLLALADDPHGNGLDAARRESSLHLVPEDRADLVTHEPIEDAACLLGLVSVAVQGQGVLDGRQHRVLRQVVEEHAVERFALGPDLLGDVPGDSLALAVGVRGEEDRVGGLRGLLEFRDNFLLGLEDLVGRAEVVLDVDSERVAGQVLHVAYGGPDVELRAEVFLDGLHLRGRLDDDQCIRHQGSFTVNRFPGSCTMYPLSSRDNRSERASAAARPVRVMRVSASCGFSVMKPRSRDSLSVRASRPGLSCCALSVRATRPSVPFGRAAGGRSSCGRISSRMSSALSTSLAPCRSSLFVPREPGRSILPGTAKTSRFCSSAHRAVMSEPLFSPASTMRTPSERPLMMRLRAGKCGRSGAEGKFRHDGAVRGDLAVKLPVFRRVDHVDAAAHHGDCPAPRREGPAVGAGVDAAGQPADDGRAPLRKLPAELLRDIPAVGACVTRPDDGDRDICRVETSFYIEKRGRVVDPPQPFRVSRVLAGDDRDPLALGPCQLGAGLLPAPKVLDVACRLVV